MNSQHRFALNYFCLFAAFAVVTPYLQALLRAQGYSKTQIGALFSILEVIGILSPPLWGWISDHSRRRRLILAAAILGASGCFALFGLARAYPQALAVAILFGFFYRPIIPLTDGLVVRYQAEHGGDYGRPRTAGSFAFILVTLVLERLGVAGEHGPTLILSAMVACSLAHALSNAALPLSGRDHADRASPAPRRRVEWAILRRRPFALFVAMAFLVRFSMTSYYSFFTLFLREEIGYDKAGYLWLIGPIAEIPVIFFSGAIIRRIGARNLFVLACLGAMARLEGYAWAPGIRAIIALQFLHCLTLGAFHTASIHYVNRIVPHDMKQSAMTVFSALVLGGAGIVGSLIGGALIDWMGYRTMYAIYGGVAAVAMIGTLWLIREPPLAPQEALPVPEE